MSEPAVFQSMAMQFADAPFAALLTDPDLNIRYANKYAEEMSRMLGFSDGIRLLVPQEELEACRQKLQAGESSRLFSSPLRAASVCLAVSPLREEGRVVGGFVTVAPEDQAPDTLAKAVEGDGASALSGSFRYPLSQIFASLSVILRKLHADGNHTLDQPVGVINRNAYLMLRNINNIVARIRLFSGYRAEPVVVDLWERSAELMEAASITLRPSGHILTYSFPQDKACVRCRYDQVAIALLNIISNACKASPGGGAVSVTGKRHGNTAILTVSDMGQGIPQERMDRIFEPFFSSGAVPYSPPSMGLGLSVAKQIIYDEGGTLAIHSREGEGTSVAFTLPVVEEEADERMPLECGPSAYLLDRFSPVYWCLADVIEPPGQ